MRVWQSRPRGRCCVSVGHQAETPGREVPCGHHPGGRWAGAREADGHSGAGEEVSGEARRGLGLGNEAERMRLLLFADETESQPDEAPELSGQLFMLVGGCLASEGRVDRGHLGPGPGGDCVPAAYPLTASSAKGHAEDTQGSTALKSRGWCPGGRRRTQRALTLRDAHGV